MGGEFKMKKVLRHLTHSWIILSILVFSICPVFAFETEALIPRVEILTPGMTRRIEISQNDNFPQDFSQFLILLVGNGPLSITLSKFDTEGDLLFLIGLGISFAGIEHVFKFGMTAVTLTKSLEIGNERSPYGLLWILSWVDPAVDNPPYNYTLTLSF
jgi:hypothetical protein